jgi:SAM-dependent methyltransferase
MENKYGGWFSNKFLNILYLSTIAFIFLQYINDATIHNTVLAVILFALFLFMLGFTLFLRFCNRKLEYKNDSILDHKARSLMKRLSIKDKKCTVLDLGCKKGFTSILLAKNKRALIKSVDINDECRSHLKEAKVNKRVEAIASPLTSLPFKDETFDYVYSFFPSKKDSTDIIKEGLRVLKKNGYIAFEGHCEDVSSFEELGLHVIYDYKDVPGYLMLPGLLKDSVIIYGKKSH